MRAGGAPLAPPPPLWGGVARGRGSAARRRREEGEGGGGVGGVDGGEGAWRLYTDGDAPHPARFARHPLPASGERKNASAPGRDRPCSAACRWRRRRGSTC